MSTEMMSLSTEQRKALESKNVSDSIRYLDSQGYARADIARILGKRYQHVRNVLVRSTESGVRRKTLNFSILADSIGEFRRQCKALGRNADRYLNQVLNQGISELKDRVPNSTDAAASLVEYYRADIAPYSSSNESVKIESPLVEQITSECKRLRIPIDFFVTAVIDTANVALEEALEIADNPFGHLKDSGTDHLSSYIKSDEEVEELEEWRFDDELLYEAVGLLKNVSINDAACAVTKLTRDQKEAMKNKPEVSEIMHRLRSREWDPVVLDDLLN